MLLNLVWLIASIVGLYICLQLYIRQSWNTYPLCGQYTHVTPRNIFHSFSGMFICFDSQFQIFCSERRPVKSFRLRLFCVKKFSVSFFFQFLLFQLSTWRQFSFDKSVLFRFSLFADCFVFIPLLDCQMGQFVAFLLLTAYKLQIRAYCWLHLKFVINNNLKRSMRWSQKKYILLIKTSFVTWKLFVYGRFDQVPTSIDSNK